MIVIIIQIVVLLLLHLQDSLLLRRRISSVVRLRGLNLTVGGHFDPRPVQIISLHAIEAAEDEQPLVVQNDRLVESARREGDVEGDAPRPRLQLEIVLVNVIESFEGEVDPTKDIQTIKSLAFF